MPVLMTESNDVPDRITRDERFMRELLERVAGRGRSENHVRRQPSARGQVVTRETQSR